MRFKVNTTINSGDNDHEITIETRIEAIPNITNEKPNKNNHECKNEYNNKNNKQ